MSLSVKRVTTMLAFSLAAMADQVQHPLRLQFNSEVLRTLFHKGDQRMLEAFTDLKLTLEEPSEKCPSLTGATFSMTVQEDQNLDDYDFDVSINDADKGYLGFEGKNLRMVGKAKFEDDKELSFTAPVDKFRLEAEFVKEDNDEVIAINKNAQEPTVKDFQFDVGTVTFDEASIAAPAECLAELHEGLEHGVMAMYDSIWSGDLDSLSTMPVESFLPLIGIRHVGGFAMEQSITSSAIEFGFDPEMVFERVRPTPKAKQSMLKEINHNFSERKEDEDDKLLSLIIDENAINSFLLEFVLVERAFSLREFIKTDPRLREALMQLNTSSLAVVLPQVVEEFGENRAMDFYISMSHSLVSNKLDGVKPTGFQMDKNGNIKFVFNLSITLLIEDKATKKWDEARAMFMSFTAKGKVTTNTTNKYGDKMLNAFPKSAEISQLKIFNKDGEEKELEQMLLTSGFNVQMEQLFKMIPPFEMPMKNIPSPPELD